MIREVPVEAIGVADGRIRVVIESIEPAVDGGRLPIKRVVGDEVAVEADCFADGHDVVACALQWRPGKKGAWQTVPMAALGNDRWRAAFTVDALGPWQYQVCAWVDPFQSWEHDFARRIDADDVRIAAATGAELIDASYKRSGRGSDSKLLRAWARQLATAVSRGAETEELKRIGTDEAGTVIARRYPDMTHAFTYPQVFEITVERERARFSSWYEFFPRSASDDPARHGTFADCEAWLPYVKRMGFDVLYFPPIHPIGRTKRKGRNNTLDAKSDDVGSPWAIGAAEGGHEAILSELGTLEDFKHLVQSATAQDIDIALDIAFQCAPDHPWVTEHPEWFKKRSDGSIQYAENPPKKYQDIYPFDFETEDWQAMWRALAGVFEYWIEQGVRVFRVDNPHTKAYPFWEWAIARIRSVQPEVVFLSEAFTRPRVMHRLAKVGFSQSYTYFTWRNSKQELTEYFTELSAGPGIEYFRPNVWPNTPDILPGALQQGSRPVYMTRVAMAATLSANFGIYGPAYELLEYAPLKVGGEEYRDSEKFERRTWDRHRADSLADFIAVLNRVRRDNPALQRDTGLVFLDIDNPQMLAYAKTTPDHSNTVVSVVNLDPVNVQSGWLRIDPAAFGLAPGQPYAVHDAVSGADYTWDGTHNYVSLDPQRVPCHVLLLQPPARRENDVDNFA